ncbi:MAG: hypothetical protein CUN52_12170, partial [Phototrophicales bacterium]
MPLYFFLYTIFGYKFYHMDDAQMTDSSNTATLQALLQYALPLGSTLLAGSPDITIQWAVTIRAQPPAFPDINGGELALVSMDIVR